MPLKINSFRDGLLDSLFPSILSDLEDYFGFKISQFQNPKLFIVRDRQTINTMKGKKTPGWMVGWSDGCNVFLLDRKRFTTESEHTYSIDKYKALLKHELVHIFYDVLSSRKMKPIWLAEGVSIFVSGQNSFRQKPSIFQNFLEYEEVSENTNGNVYQESGFFVELLAERYGKETLIKFIKESAKFKTTKDLKTSFMNLYGFELNYKNINTLYLKK